MSERKERDFYARDQISQTEFLHYTWCNICMDSDLGMTDPVEFEQEHQIFIEGSCKVCGATVTTELQEDDDGSDNQ